MAIEIVKAIWVKEVEAYIVAIEGKKYLLDLPEAKEKATIAKVDKPATKAIKNTKKSTISLSSSELSDIAKMIEDGNSPEDVKKKHPKMNLNTIRKMVRTLKK